MKIVRISSLIVIISYLILVVLNFNLIDVSTIIVSPKLYKYEESIIVHDDTLNNVYLYNEQNDKFDKVVLDTYGASIVNVYNNQIHIYLVRENINVDLITMEETDVPRAELNEISSYEGDDYLIKRNILLTYYVSGDINVRVNQFNIIYPILKLLFNISIIYWLFVAFDHEFSTIKKTYQTDIRKRQLINSLILIVIVGAYFYQLVLLIFFVISVFAWNIDKNMTEQKQSKKRCGENNGIQKM